MPFTDQQRTTIHTVDALLNRLGCDIAIGPLPEGIHLTGISLRKGAATITGRGNAGGLKA